MQTKISIITTLTESRENINIIGIVKVCNVLYDAESFVLRSVKGEEAIDFDEETKTYLKKYSWTKESEKTGN